LTMVYIMIYAVSALLRMAHTLEFNWGGTPAVKAQLSLPPKERVQHWVIVPQYKEDIEGVHMMLDSVASSTIATTMVCIMLAMEEREQGAAEKVDQLKAAYRNKFHRIEVSYHPPNLPNDPPGKASNVSWAFKSLTKLLSGCQIDLANVILTVADADSEFHKSYFEYLTNSFLISPKERRACCIWQSPIYHMKNYHRQPCFVVVGTILAALHELATLGDPHAVRFPYSTYSLSYALAWRVGGWDPGWIAEDWHMGIKCFLMTLGQCVIEPILLPTVNYTPEDTTWYTTVVARWTQAKRHALGFSDLTYYFKTLPLVFGHCVSTPSEDGSLSGLASFWNMLFKGFLVCMKIVNVHVLLGVLTTYCVLTAALKLTMTELFRPDRNIMSLFTQMDFITKTLFFTSALFMFMHAATFVLAYSQVKKRLEGDKWSSTLCHLAYTFGCLLIISPFFIAVMVAAVWKAALNVIVTSTFEYEVALKPKLEKLDAKLKCPNNI